MACVHSILVSRGPSALLFAGVLGLSGCVPVGVRSIAAGRGAYTEVINRTEDEQILGVIVRQRYDETFGMLSVASVTASLRFSTQVGANVGIGPDESFAGNLVPLSAGVAYEENPTISYVPLSGEDFMRRMLSPVSVEEWLLLGGPARHPGEILTLAVRRINGLHNPLYAEEPASPGFLRLAAVYDELRRAEVLNIVRALEVEPSDDSTSDREQPRHYLWYIHDYEDAHGDGVRELLDLLGITVKVDGGEILLPVRDAVGASDSAVHLQTRSAFDVLRVFGAGIEVPTAHLEAGIVEPIMLAMPNEARFMTILSSEDPPDVATVQIRFRDRWFYIDATDARSKRAFAFLRTFIGMRLASSGAGSAAPVLTVPVG